MGYSQIPSAIGIAPQPGYAPIDFISCNGVTPAANTDTLLPLAGVAGQNGSATGNLLVTPSPNYELVFVNAGVYELIIMLQQTTSEATTLKLSYNGGPKVILGITDATQKQIQTSTSKDVAAGDFIQLYVSNALGTATYGPQDPTGSAALIAIIAYRIVPTQI